MRKLLILLLVPFLLGASYYVKNGGNDGSAGTSDGTAWATLDKISGVNALSAGDIVYFNKGDSWNECIEFRSSGSEGNPITWTSYGTGDLPEIDVLNTCSTGIFFNRRSPMVIDGLKFTGGMTEKPLVDFWGGQDTVIKNCEFKDAPNVYQALRIVNYGYVSTDETADWLIENNTFDTIGTRTDSDAIRITTSNTDYPAVTRITIDNNIFTNTAGNGIRTFHSEATHAAGYYPTYLAIVNNTLTDIGFDAMAVTGKNFYIANNYAKNIGLVTNPNINAFQFHDLDDSIIENNTVIDVETSVCDGSGIILDFAFSNDAYLTDRAIVRNNYVEDCASCYTAKCISIWKGTDNKIYNNIMVGCPRGAGASNEESSGNEFYDNTIIGTGAGTGIYLWRDTPQVIIKNNIIKDFGYGIVIAAQAVAADEDYNLFYNNTLSDYYSADLVDNVALGANSITGSDPQLTGNYAIPTGSPAENEGIALSDVIRDYRGLGRSDPPDIGAMEIGGAGQGR